MTHRSAHIAARYDANAHRYDDVTLHNREASERLVTLLPEGRFERLLDVGCGTGFATEAVLRRFSPTQVTGIDLSAEMLERFRDKVAGRPDIEVRLVTGDALDLETRGVQADLVIASMMLHWVEDRPAAIRAMAAAAAPGGVVAIVAPGPGHDREYADLLRTIDPPVPHEVIDVFRAAQVFPDATEAALIEAGLEPIDVWMETRHRTVPPQRYMARITAVGSHVWTALMGPEAAEEMLGRINAAIARASEPSGWSYTFTKTYAIARRPVDANPAAIA